MTNRVIKFRAWSGGGNILRVMKYFDIFTAKDFDLIGLPIMQFTGLLDKNGKEIYEGDIVSDFFRTKQELSGNPSVVSIGWGDDNEKYMESYGWLFGSDIVGGSPESIRNYEVIGNIYENPELLGYE